jgi:glyoxylase-like metal-dependent hydrolase (beta-lactamase superfamily II)
MESKIHEASFGGGESTMDFWRIGSVEVHKVEEIPPIAVDITGFMPTATPELLAAGRTWIPANMLHPTDPFLYLSFHSFVVRTPQHNILVDTCNGNCKQRGKRRANMLQTRFLEDLARTGIVTKDIDIVLCTHLHADHVGWNTMWQDGAWIPTFPNAKYLFGQDEYAHWKRCFDVDPTAPLLRGSFLDSVLPVVLAGQAQFVSSDHVIEDSPTGKIWLEPSPGHSPGHICLNVESAGSHGLFCGDVIHHPLQMMDPELGMAMDFHAAQATRTRVALLNRLAGSHTLLFTAHFPNPSAVHVINDSVGFRYRHAEPTLTHTLPVGPEQ